MASFTSLASSAIVVVEARSVMAWTWQRCVSASEQTKFFVSDVTSNKRIVPLWMPTAMKLNPRAASSILSEMDAARAARLTSLISGAATQDTKS